MRLFLWFSNTVKELKHQGSRIHLDVLLLLCLQYFRLCVRWQALNIDTSNKLNRINFMIEEGWSRDVVIDRVFLPCGRGGEAGWWNRGCRRKVWRAKQATLSLSSGWAMHTNWAQNGLSTQTLNDNDVDEEEPEEEEEEAPTTIENVVRLRSGTGGGGSSSLHCLCKDKARRFTPLEIVYIFCLHILHKYTLFENYSKYRIWHFPPIFVLLKLICLVTLFDRKSQVFKNSPN